MAVEEIKNEVIEEVTEEVTEPVEQKTYNLRKLCSRDIFPFSRIVAKIGVKEFSECFTKKRDVQKEAEINSGMETALSAIDVLLRNLYKCETEVFIFLASMAGSTPEQVMESDPADMVNMIAEICNSKQFEDFFKAVLRLLGMGR